MNELINNEFNMNHVELCELINRLRIEEGNRKELRTDHLLTKIRKEVETLKTLGLNSDLNFWGGSYKDKQNQERPTYLMNRDGVLQIASSESVYVRAKIIEYINALENKIKEQDRKKDLLLAIYEGGQNAISASKQLTELEVKEATKPLLNTIEELEPKAKYTDDVLNSDRLLSTTEIAKDLGMSARRLNNLLSEKEVIYKRGGTWFLYSKYQDMIPEYADYKISEYGQLLKWTELGRKFIIELLNNENK